MNATSSSHLMAVVQWMHQNISVASNNSSFAISYHLVHKPRYGQRVCRILGTAISRDQRVTGITHRKSSAAVRKYTFLKYASFFSLLCVSCVQISHLNSVLMPYSGSCFFQDIFSLLQKVSNNLTKY